MSAITDVPGVLLRRAEARAAASAPASVTVIDASMQSPMTAVYPQTSPLGRSIETMGMDEALTSATIVSIMPAQRRLQSRPEDRVHDQRALRNLRRSAAPSSVRR
jgi:hypothetical protein